jgi:hypothetical protein
MKKKIVKIIVLLLIFLVGLLSLNSLLIPDKNKTRWSSFYKLPDNTIDMLFIGSSHCFTGFVPMIFNETLNIDSYHIGMAGTSIEQIYFMLIEALKTQKPKIVVIELFSIRPIKTDSYEAKFIHSAFDGMKLSKNKIEAVNSNVSAGKRFEYFFQLAKYHSFWKDMDLNTLLHSTTNNAKYYGYKGLYTTPYKTKGEKIIIDSPELNEIKYLPQSRIDILDDIAKLCSDNNIELIYVNVPFIKQLGVSQIELAQYVNGYVNYAKDKDIDILEYRFFNEVGLDKTHLWNDGHINIEGAYLISNHLANYISDNYSESLNGITYDLKAETEQKLAEYLSELAVFENSRKN